MNLPIEMYPLPGDKGFAPRTCRRQSTSAEAYESIRPHLNAQEKQVMDEFDAWSKTKWIGLTDEECQGVTGLSPSSQRPRRIALVDAGRLKDSGLTRKTSSGRSAIVWAVAESCGVMNG